MPQDTPPLLFDQDARKRARARGDKLASGGDFLRAEIADRLQDRLLDIQRAFEVKIDLGGDLSDPSFRRIPLTDTLDIEPKSADLIVSNLALHSVNDLVGVLVQSGFALRPDGFLMASLFGGETLSELRQCLLEAEVALTGRAAQRVHPMADVRDLGGLLGRAGLALPVADVDRITVTYEHPMKLLQDLRAMGEVNIMRERSRAFLRRDVLMRAMQLYMEKFQQDDGRVIATFDIIYLSAWKPAPTQQQPLKPGSGQVNLKDALGAAPPKKA